MSITLLSKLLPLPSEDLQQILDYANTVSLDEVSAYFHELLGNSTETTKFINDFISAAQKKNDDIPNNSSNKKKKNKNYVNALSSSKNHAHQLISPTAKKNQPKKKTFIQTSGEEREVEVSEDLAHKGTQYFDRKNEGNIVEVAKKVAFNSKPSSRTQVSSQSQPQRIAFSSTVTAGTLNSDSLYHPTNYTPNNSKDAGKGGKSFSKAKNKTKISISGGKASHGESTVISELDAAIRALEISTNSKLNSKDSSNRACNCIGTRHPVLAAAPNCLSCGKVICVLEGLGPCTFCGMPLLSSVEVQSMISHLREERGREKMLADNLSRKRAEVASTPKPFSTPREYSSNYYKGEDQKSSAELQAQAHRDKLLSFQSQNTKRTTVHDEVADFNIDESEVRRDMLWATPAERANALKKQQKLREEMEWQAKPEYEKRKFVVSLDIVSGKVVKQIRKSVREPESAEAREEEEPKFDLNTKTSVGEMSDLKILHNFKKNPLIGNLTRPIWSGNLSQGTKISAEGNEKEGKWGIKTRRRVLDDQDDNEDVILDGGLSGGQLTDSFS